MRPTTPTSAAPSRPTLTKPVLFLAALIGALFVLSPDLPTREAQAAERDGRDGERGRALPVQLGPRPFYLLDRLRPGRLKDDLERCAARKTRYRASDFSIGPTMRRLRMYIRLMYPGRSRFSKSTSEPPTFETTMCSPPYAPRPSRCQ